MKPIYKKTIFACYLGYVIQAIVNNFIPLLFLTFQEEYEISITKITMLITLNFMIQLVVDLTSAHFIDKIGYRTAALLAHAFTVMGLISLTFLPELFSDAFLGLMISVTIYAIGGGLLEVLLSPIIEALPTDDKEKTMSLLHSFYCWGYVFVVLFSTIFFQIFGIENWKILSLLWAIIPIINFLSFTKVPILPLIEEKNASLSLMELFRKPIFWLLMIVMLCAGASEQAVAQWASTFAEQGLGVSKTVGDLMGPMLFALFMGSSRLLYGKYGEKLNLYKAIAISSMLCILSYVFISLSPLPFLSLLGCGLCGFSVGILWPGTFSIASSCLRKGRTALFAFLALAGDLGCSSGPTFVGFIFNKSNGNFKLGILLALIFPVILLITLLLLHIFKQKERQLEISPTSQSL